MQILARDRTQYMQLIHTACPRIDSTLIILLEGVALSQEQEIHEHGSGLLGRAAPDKPKTSQLTCCTVAENYPLLHELLSHIKWKLTE